MSQIIKIFQIDSNKDFIEISEISEYEVKDFGNGFFISNNGYLASVAHVLTDIGCNSFALYNGKLQKIEIIESIFTDEEEENHLDAAIGKINVNQTDYFNPLCFKRVTENEELQLIGYSRILNRKEHSSKNVVNGSLIILKALCNNVKYAYMDSIIMYNSFALTLNHTRLYGMSGSPVVNNNNNVVGIYKGGSNLRNHAIHIDAISKILKNHRIIN